MGATVSLQMDPADKIKLKRKLGSNKQAQKFFTHEVRRLCDPYVPFATGMLKNTAIERTTQIEYIQPYARRQYYENKGNGLRGKEWDKRMWADKGPQILQSVARYCGGTTTP